jgi:hypothetical protein
MPLPEKFRSGHLSRASVPLRATKRERLHGLRHGGVLRRRGGRGVQRRQVLRRLLAPPPRRRPPPHGRAPVPVRQRARAAELLLQRRLLGSEHVKGHGAAKGEATAGAAATGVLLRTSRRRSTRTLQAARRSQARWRGGAMGGYASEYSHTGPVRGTMRFLRLVRQPSRQTRELTSRNTTLLMSLLEAMSNLLLKWLVSCAN